MRVLGKLVVLLTIIPLGVALADSAPGKLTIADFPRTPPEVHARLYEQVALIHRVAAEQNIAYWLIGGSLLGQVRGELLNGAPEMIPWDDDADVGINIADKDRLMAALSTEAAKVGMTVWNTEHGLKLKCLTKLQIGTDIFFYRKVASHDHEAHKSLQRTNDNGVWVLAMEESVKAWPRDFFLPEELEQLKLVKFGPIEAMIPFNAMRYLQTLYGKDCMSVAKLDFNHMENRKHDNAGKSVPLTDLKPN
jgi:phosphorylcholine metabolism protein LicD